MTRLVLAAVIAGLVLTGSTTPVAADPVDARPVRAVVTVDGTAAADPTVITTIPAGRQRQAVQLSLTCAGHPCASGLWRSPTGTAHRADTVIELGVGRHLVTGYTIHDDKRVAVPVEILIAPTMLDVDTRDAVPMQIAAALGVLSPCRPYGDIGQARSCPQVNPIDTPPVDLVDRNDVPYVFGRCDDLQTATIAGGRWRVTTGVEPGCATQADLQLLTAFVDGQPAEPCTDTCHVPLTGAAVHEALRTSPACTSACLAAIQTLSGRAALYRIDVARLAQQIAGLTPTDTGPQVQPAVTTSGAVTLRGASPTIPTWQTGTDTGRCVPADNPFTDQVSVMTNGTMTARSALPGWQCDVYGTLDHDAVQLVSGTDVHWVGVDVQRPTITVIPSTITVAQHDTITVPLTLSGLTANDQAVAVRFPDQQTRWALPGVQMVVDGTALTITSVRATGPLSVPLQVCDGAGCVDTRIELAVTDVDVDASIMSTAIIVWPGGTDVVVDLPVEDPDTVAPTMTVTSVDGPAVLRSPAGMVVAGGLVASPVQLSPAGRPVWQSALTIDGATVTVQTADPDVFDDGAWASVLTRVARTQRIPSWATLP